MGGDWKWIFFSLFMVSACCWCGRLCFCRGRDRGFVLYISLFLRVLGWWVRVCLYTRVHIHKLLGYLMWAQVWDGHLESQKKPDRLKHSIHVDRIGVQSTFIYICAGLRVLMIWANYCFLLTCLFFWEIDKSRRCDDNQQITYSHFGEHKRLHLESSKQNYYIISFMSNNKRNLHLYRNLKLGGEGQGSPPSTLPRRRHTRPHQQGSLPKGEYGPLHHVYQNQNP